MKKIKIFTTAGGKYLDWYNKYTLPSIRLDIENLKKEGYDVSLIQNGFKSNKITKHEINQLILSGLREVIKQCIDENNIFFLAPPDTIFSKNTLYNLIKISENRNGCCVAVPHFRILPNDEINVPINNLNLVKLLLKYPHYSFAKSYDDDDTNCTWAGITTRKISDNIYAITHNLPTIYVVNFIESDIDWWNKCNNWSDWDRLWLKHICLNNRIKIIGASDMAFCIELTDVNENIPFVKNGLLYNDKWINQENHNEILNKNIFVMRSN